MAKIEKEIANFITSGNMKTPEFASYRDRCLRHWRKVYGETLTTNIRKEIVSQWKEKKIKGRPFSPLAFIDF